MNCCNCNRPIADQLVNHVADMGPEIVDIIEQWRNEGVRDGDCLCQECLNRVLGELDRPNVVFNINHCIWCNISLLRLTGRRSRLIPVGRPERIYIAQMIHPRQVPADARVCNRCWQQAHYNRHLVQPEQEIEEPQPAPEQAAEPAPDQAAEPALEQAAGPAPEQAAGPAPEQAAGPAPELAAEPVPEQAAEPAPEQAAEPALEQAAGPAPEQVAGPAPEQAAGPAPELAAEPVPEQAAEPAPEQAAEPAPEQAAEPAPANIRQTIELINYCRTPNTPVHCFVPECQNVERLRVPLYIRKKLLNEKKIFITEGARVCALHASTYDWDFIDQYEFTSRTFNNEDIEKMLQISQSNEVDIINFENVTNMRDELCRYWTGLTVINFLALFQCVEIYLNVLFKKPKKALAVYLAKIRTGDSFARIASVFALSESMAQNYVRKVRNCLQSYYVPLHLGLHHISRDELSNRNLLIPQGIFGTQARNPITICDGSYIYMQKSSNYFFQKKSYSLHKFRNLVKPMMFVATDGHIIDLFGPYAATMSDADIMNNLFNETSELRQYYQPNDIFILDRGFRDSLNLLTSLGYSLYKPHSLTVGQNQLSTRQANESRLVTMCRWVVEIVNGRFKRDYKIFRNEYFNRMSKNLITDFKIAAAIINNFHPVVTDRIDAQLILNRALERRYMENYLGEYVRESNLNRRRAQFINIDAQIPALDMFPLMQMSDLILFCLGTYQLKQARSYYGEHIRANGTFTVEICTDFETVQIPNVLATEPVLIRDRIRSRFHGRTIYYTYILIDTVTNNWEDGIRGYYCSCIIGNRTVGSCAHVATIVWYLGWARFQDNVNPPAPFLDEILVRDDID